MKLTAHLHLMPEAISPVPHIPVVMGWCLIKHRQLYVYLTPVMISKMASDLRQWPRGQGHCSRDESPWKSPCRRGTQL